MSNTYVYPNTIEEAANILDKAKPHWYRNVDLNELDMDNASRCILGQVYRDYNIGFKKLFGLNPYDEDYFDDKIFGAEAPISVWEAMINSRLLKAGISSLTKEKNEASLNTDQFNIPFHSAWVDLSQGKTIEDESGLTYKLGADGFLYCSHSPVMPVMISGAIMNTLYRIKKNLVKVSELKDRQDFALLGRKYTSLVPKHKGCNSINWDNKLVNISENEVVELI